MDTLIDFYDCISSVEYARLCRIDLPSLLDHLNILEYLIQSL